MMRTKIIDVITISLLLSCNSNDSINQESINTLKLNCNNAMFSPLSVMHGSVYNGVLIIPYTGGNGKKYPAEIFNNGGLTFSRNEGVLDIDNGEIVYNVTGKPSGAEISMVINISKQSCTIKGPNVIEKCGAYIAPGVWKEFACHNLGADTNKDPFTPDAGIHGAKYQWGAFNTEITSPNIRYINQVNDQFYSNSFVGWALFEMNNPPHYNVKPDGSWTSSDPCKLELGVNWRVPTPNEWAGVANKDLNPQYNGGTFSFKAEDFNNYGAGKWFGKSLFLPAGGKRSSNIGAPYNRSYAGYYWSSIPGGNDYAHSLSFNNSAAYASANTRTDGASVRCIKD
ncbi:fibrobacter succinogenes major paralogous domain-containing protein [Elizabethkingia miricola]|uniref:hypothetical protein n=1 Tax=Elizabethkingia miricola TaxID=172045 RepID=UPI003891DDBC